MLIDFDWRGDGKAEYPASINPDAARYCHWCRNLMTTLCFSNFLDETRFREPASL